MHWGGSGEEAEAGGGEGGADGGDVGCVEGLKLEMEEAGVDLCGGADALVVDGEDVAALLGYDFEHGGEGAGLVLQLEFELAEAAVFGESAVDDAVEHVDVDVSA